MDAADEKKIWKSSSSMDDEFKIPLVWAGDNCDLTREQAREERREQKHLHILAIMEFRANKPRPRNKSKFTHSHVPVTVVYSNYLPHDTIPPEGRVLPASRAKVLNKDLGVSSEEKQKIYQSPVTKAFAKL